jgi:hypothetical protein
MLGNFYHEWIDELSDESVLYLVNEIWGKNDFNRSNTEYLKKCFKSSGRVYDYYLTYVVIGD